MNKIIKYTLPALSAAAVLSSCYREPELKVTDAGPEMTYSIPEIAYMGENMPFKVTLKDKIALSTAQFHLFFDGTEVSKTVIRTKESGTYEGALKIPYYADVADGTAELEISGQNIQFGKTELKAELPVSRPKFDYLTLITEDGKEYRMDKTGDYEFACTAEFPKNLNARIESSPFGTNGEKLVFGYEDSGIAAGGSGYIPFSGGFDGKYKISLNTKTLKGSPFGVSINGKSPSVMKAADEIPEGSSGVSLALEQGQTITISGIDLSGWNIDSDYIETIDPAAGTFKFLPVSGQYRIVLQTSNNFIRINPMTTAALTGAANFPVLNDDFTGALWAIGDETIGKPEASGKGWNPEAGGLCCSPISAKKFQLTLKAGSGLGTAPGSNFKFFFQRTWGGELKGASFSEVTLPAELGMTDDGNIGVVAELAAGTVYRFTVDFSGAQKAKVGGSDSATGVKLTCEKL